MYIRWMEIKFLGNLVVRQVQPHEIQAKYPHPKGLMMTGEDHVRHIVEASLTGLTQVALPLGLGIVAPLFGYTRTVTRWTKDAVWPTEGTDGLKAFGVVDERLNVYHGVSIAHWARRNKGLIKAYEPDAKERCQLPGIRIEPTDFFHLLMSIPHGTLR